MSLFTHVTTVGTLDNPPKGSTEKGSEGKSKGSVRKGKKGERKGKDEPKDEHKDEQPPPQPLEQEPGYYVTHLGLQKFYLLEENLYCLISDNI